MIMRNPQREVKLRRPFDSWEFDLIPLRKCIKPLLTSYFAAFITVFEVVCVCVACPQRPVEEELQAVVSCSP